MYMFKNIYFHIIKADVILNPYITMGHSIFYPHSLSPTKIIFTVYIASWN